MLIGINANGIPESEKPLWLGINLILQTMLSDLQ